ncbi:HEAT repeat domain-containing protein [Ekhidna sp. MALMAid0563]|uniref:HEAT repeat domain-containing protein n=1 Tax=Ekhidna sp. MALMAid0563 TaxID=3143937 RepID=UPI0032DE80D2
MNSIERFLYNHRILKLTENKLERWNRTDAIDKLIFAAENGMYNIRLKCIEQLTNRTRELEIDKLLVTLISDDVEVVSEAAIEALEQTASPEQRELIEQTRKNWKLKNRKKKRPNSYIANIQLGDTGKPRPSDRLMETLRSQQQTNHPPFGF